MQNYIDLLKDITENGLDKGDRTGVGTRAIFGRSMRWNLRDGFPIITTRKVAFRIAFEETMFFLRGESDTTKLEEKKIKIWSGNTTREFLDNRGLTNLPVGDMGRGYGVQWRDWNTTEILSAGDTVTLQDGSEMWYGATVHSKSTDQLVEVIEGLKRDPNGRRHIITAWNPGELNLMALPPCHITHQYIVNDGRLDSSWLQRSVDSVFGLPYNIMSYAFMNVAFAKLLGLEPGELVFFGNDVHIYNNQLEMAYEQITRSPRPLPKLTITKPLNTLDDLLSLEFSDVVIEGYDPYPDFKDKPPMAI